MCHCRQEFRLRDKAGQIRWAMTSSLPKPDRDGSTIWYGFLSDVTEAKATTEALRRGEERLRAALEATRAAVWEIDVHDNSMFLSPEWGHLFGFAPEQFPRTFAEWLDTVHPEDVAAVRPLRETVAGGEGGQFEFRHRRENGDYLWVLMRGKPVHDAEGELIRQIGTFVDITDRHLTNRQLIEAKEAAERASEAKGEFLAMMSHEIRTPLNAVLGFSELLGAMPLEPEQADYLRTIQENSSALLVILNDVLDYSKIESGRLDLHPAPVDLARLVRSAAEFFRAQAVNKDIALDVHCAPNVPEKLLCDAARIHQILYNLISNAVKFTDRGTVRVELDVAGERVDGRWPVRIRVSDSGIGIALDRHPGLFDPFYQADSSTRRRHGGTGLGLAIVKRLASLMDGVIGIQSREGEGTIFTVRLSLPEPETEEPETALNDKSGTVNLSKLLPKILVIEDNATNRRLVRLFLRKFGLDADEAENGYDGVALAAAKKYDVIFMDLEMPGMDGYEATRLIREADPGRVPYIVALTAHAMPEYRERSLRAGMSAYLSKPVKQIELKQVIRDAMRRLR
jgi:PAS domain S-box-containing protein